MFTQIAGLCVVGLVAALFLRTVTFGSTEQLAKQSERQRNFCRPFDMDAACTQTRLGCVPPSSVVHSGHRLALIGIVFVQAGHSFETFSAPGAGRFSLFAAFTIMKIANATMKKFISRVTKLP